MITTAFYDPAAKEGKQHDYKAIVVGTLIDSIYYVRYAFIRRCSTQEVLEQLYTIDARFPGVFQGFEANGFQGLYKLLLEYKAKDKGYPVRIHEHTTTGNKYVRIEGLEGFVNTGQILFQKDANGYTSDIGLLVDQLEDFPNGAHDDGPDALAYAYEMARQKAIKAAYRQKRKTQDDAPAARRGLSNLRQPGRVGRRPRSPRIQYGLRRL